tara:strand:- start:2 stop:418 length:417 start_codon:yes stop_codon:yes gene_type:complete
MKLSIKILKSLITEELSKIIESDGSSVSLFNSLEDEDIKQALELYNSIEDLPLNDSIEFKNVDNFLWRPDPTEDPEYYPQLTFFSRNQHSLDKFAKSLIADPMQSFSYYIDDDFNQIKIQQKNDGFEVTLINWSALEK